MLTLYRRHLKSCVHRSKGRSYRRCRCPIWVQGTTTDGKPVRESLKLVNWEKAQTRIRDWEDGRRDEPQPEVTNVSEAIAEFLSDTHRRRLAPSTIEKYQTLLKRLEAWCEDRGLQHLRELTLGETRRFCGTWTQGRLTCSKNLERLRTFFRFAVESRWVAENPAKKIALPTAKPRPTLPFARPEMVSILEACERYPGDGRRMKAFALLLRYSGLRIGDAARLRKDQLNGCRLFLYTQKTGVPVYVPLPRFVVEALEGCRHASETHFFWTGNSSRENAPKIWALNLDRVFKRAGIQGAHPHRFRDTFAVELLLEGVPIERVSVLLGHSSVRVTEKHYAPWVRSRQEQLEADVERSWAKDPIALSETKGTRLVHSESELLN